MALIKTVWVLQGVCVPGTLLVFINYWCLVFPFSSSVAVISFFTHGFNFAVQLADLVVNSQPYLLMHGAYFAAFAALYLVWSAIHYEMGIGDGDGHQSIYKALDWGSPGSAATVGAVIMLFCFPMLNCACWCFVGKLRGHQHGFDENASGGDPTKQVDGSGSPDV